MTNMAMQQGAAGGANAELLNEIRENQAMMDQANAEREAALQTSVQAGAQAGAQGEPVITIPGDEGVIVIRDRNTGEEVMIHRDAIPEWLQDGPPPGVFMIPIALFASIAFVIVGLPIARAFARRMDSRNATQAAVAPSAELRQIQNSIDTMAIEIERMSEHQRFLTRVLSERTGESLPAARPGEPAARS